MPSSKKATCLHLHILSHNAGEAARNQAARNPKRTVYDAKRMIGRRLVDVEEYRALWPFEVAELDGQCAVKIGDQLVRPEEVSLALLFSSLLYS